MFIESESLEGISGTLAAKVYVLVGYNSFYLQVTFALSSWFCKNSCQHILSDETKMNQLFDCTTKPIPVLYQCRFTTQMTNARVSVSAI